MVKIELKKFVFFIMVILFISSASATFTMGKPNYSIEKNYGPGDDLKGWVNISFTNQQMNSSIQSSLGGSIRLIDLLNDGLNKNVFTYTCNPTTCKSDYTSGNGETEKNFNLNGNGSVLFGFLITGKSISEISDFGLVLASNNPETEQIPLSVDILNDGQIDWQAYNSSNNFGDEKSGCYKGIVGDVKTATIATDQAHQYCEKIELSQTPKVEIGAYVSGSGSVEFTMSIKRIDEGSYKTCVTTATGSGLQRVSCSPLDYKAEGGDYFVCIRKNNGASYQINYETKSVCGFTGNYEYKYDNDFNIFAKQGKFASSINFTLNNAELLRANSHTENIERDLNSYLTNVYRNNCSDGCIIPIKIGYNVGQNIKVSNAHMSYYSSGVFVTDSANHLYDIQEAPPRINANSQKLYLDNANFSVPEAYGNYTFSLSLGGNNIFSDNFFVGRVPSIKSLTPTTTAAKYPTKFSVKVTSDETVLKYSWDFGDGKTAQDTIINEISYTYDTVGKYKLGITVVDKQGKSASGYFDVNIAPASEIAPGLLEEAEANIALIKGQIETLTPFEQKSANKILDLENVEKNISELKIAISTASAESDYETILGRLLLIKVPNMIAETISTGGIFFYPQENDINLDALASITGDTYDAGKESAYKQSILAWNNENTNVELAYSEVSATYENYEESLLRVFDVKITNGGDQPVYLIMKDMGNLLFEKDYSVKKVGAYDYIELSGTEQKIMFSTTENVDFINLPMFISPAINNLVLLEWSPFQDEGGLKKWILFTIIIVVVLLITFIVWAVLQWWYKFRYETHLFKDRNNLYNLVSYIGNEKKKGTKEREIIEKLRKTGWNSEQLRYAVKKYDNKNTGMLEIIPLNKVLNKNEKVPPKK